jgi:hypothetical protein
MSTHAPATRGTTTKARGLAGLRIVSFESRRAQDLAVLIRQAGGEISYAPAMREIPLADETGILRFGAQLFDDECDALALFTGVGTTILVWTHCARAGNGLRCYSGWSARHCYAGGPSQLPRCRRSDCAPA